MKVEQCMTYTDPQYKRQQEIEAYQEEQKRLNASKSGAPTTPSKAPETKLPMGSETLHVTPEQTTLIEKIRKSAWKDYLKEPRWCAWFKGDPKPDGDGFA